MRARRSALPYGQRVAALRGALGATCPDCQVAYGTQCVPCPDGSPLSECTGCKDGVRPKRSTFWESSPFLGPVLIQVIGSVAVAIVIGAVLAEKKAARKR